MNRIIAAILGLSLSLGVANAQTLLNKYQPGFREINGSQLNLMVDQVNGLTGNGTAGVVKGTNGSFTGTLTVTGATTLTGNAALGGTLGVTGAATLSSTLGVTGASTFTSGSFSTTLASVGVYTPTGGIAASGGFSISPRLVFAGGWKPLAITDGTEVTCTTTTTYVSEVYVPANMTVTGVALVNATAVAGNVQVGLADSTGAPIAAALTASTAASGTGAYQRIPFAVAYAAKGPATYYIQSQCNNTGYKFRAHTVGDFGTQSQTSGSYGTFVSFTPAGTFTSAVGPVASFY